MKKINKLIFTIFTVLCLPFCSLNISAKENSNEDIRAIILEKMDKFKVEESKWEGLLQMYFAGIPWQSDTNDIEHLVTKDELKIGNIHYERDVFEDGSVSIKTIESKSPLTRVAWSEQRGIIFKDKGIINTYGFTVDYRLYFDSNDYLDAAYDPIVDLLNGKFTWVKRPTVINSYEVTSTKQGAMAEMIVKYSNTFTTKNVVYRVVVGNDKAVGGFDLTRSAVYWY